MVLKPRTLRLGAVRVLFSVLQQRQKDWSWRTQYHTATLHHKIIWAERYSSVILALQKRWPLFPLVKIH